MVDERRKNPRFAVNVEALVSHGAERFRGLLKDICRDAVLVEVQAEVAMGSELAVALELPGTGGPLLVTGKVVRLARTEHGLDVAVLFADLTPAAETRIEFFIALQSTEV
jgi:hypothetical protein